MEYITLREEVVKVHLQSHRIMRLLLDVGSRCPRDEIQDKIVINYAKVELNAQFLMLCHLF
jgi:hypothetical protein